MTIPKIAFAISEFFRSRIKSLAEWFDVRDFFMLAGFISLAYGLYQLFPWLAYVVSGLILMATGYFMGGKR